MTKFKAFTSRCAKEMSRDGLNLFFCLGFPLVLLVMFSLFDIPAEVYSVANFTPGIMIFAYSFVSMFGGMLIAKCLPFWYAVDAGRAVLNGNYVNLLTDIPVLLAWTVLMFALAIGQFGRRLKGR